MRVCWKTWFVPSHRLAARIHHLHWTATLCCVRATHGQICLRTKADRARHGKHSEPDHVNFAMERLLFAVARLAQCGRQNDDSL